MIKLLRSVLSPGLSPNTQPDDVVVAMRTMLAPWVWQSGGATSKVEEWFQKRFNPEVVASFNSGRAALLALLSSLGVGRDDEVLLQAFTCVAVPNSVLWSGARPVYVDIDGSFNIDVSDMEKKRTNKSKAIIVQHTFGTPANMDAILAFAKKHKLLVIEDCAHSLGATYKGRHVGSMGDAAFFSFGRDKVVSSVWGGIGIIHASCPVKGAGQNFLTRTKSMPMPGMAWIAQQLFHPIACAIIIPWYNSGIGKALLVVLQKLGLLSFPVASAEKKAHKPPAYPSRYPNALALLLVHQLKKLDTFTKNRQEIARYYASALKSKGVRIPTYTDQSAYLRFSLTTESAESIRARAKKNGILLGNWYSNVIDPTGVDMTAVFYRSGSCPNAEHIAVNILNLPTRITLNQAKLVASEVLV